MKKSVMGIGLLSLFLIPTSSYAADVVSAKEFRLLGPTGAITAQLTTSGEGTPAMFFYDAQGRVRLNFGLYPGGAPGVVLFDENNHAAEIVRLTDDGKTPVLVFKSDGSDKQVLGLNSDGSLREQAAAGDMNQFFLLLIVSLLGGMLGGALVTRYSLKNRG